MDAMFHLHKEVNFTPTQPQPFEANVKLDGKPLLMQVDSGCGPSIINETVYARLWLHKPPLQRADVVLRTCTREQLPVFGPLEVEAQSGSQKSRLAVLIAPGDGPPLLGRSWFGPLGIDITGVYNMVHANNKWTGHVVFQDGLGKFTGPPVSVTVDSLAAPIFRKCRPVPFAIREQVNAAIDKMVAEGVLEPVAHSKWAAPIVPVVK